MAKKTKILVPEISPEELQKRKEKWANDSVDEWYSRAKRALDDAKRELERYEKYGKDSPQEKVTNLTHAVNMCRQLDFNYYGAINAAIQMTAAFGSEKY